MVERNDQAPLPAPRRIFGYRAVCLHEMKLYKQRNGKTWSMRFVFEGRRIERSTGYTNKRKAEAYAEAFRTRAP